MKTEHTERIKAFRAALKKLGKKKVKKLIEEVQAMGIQGPTVEEYFSSFYNHDKQTDTKQ